MPASPAAAFRQSKHLHTASVYTEKILHTAGFHTQQAFTHSKPLHTESFTHSKLLHTAILYTAKLLHTANAYTHTHTQQAFTHSKHLHTASLYTAKLLHTANAYTHTANAYTHTASIYTQLAFTHSKLLHTASFYTQLAFTPRSFYTQQMLTHTASIYTQQVLTHSKLLHTASLYTAKLLHTTNAYTHSKHLHTASLYTQEAFTQRSFYTQQVLTHRSFYTQQAFTERSFYAQQTFTQSKHLHTASIYTQQAFTHSKLTASFYTQQAFTHSRLSHQASFCTEKLLQTEAFTHRKPLRCQAKGSYTVPAAGSIHLVYGQPPRVHIKIPWGHHSLRPMKKEASGYGRRACRRQLNILMSSIFACRICIFQNCHVWSCLMWTWFGVAPFGYQKCKVVKCCSVDGLINWFNAKYKPFHRPGAFGPLLFDGLLSLFSHVLPIKMKRCNQFILHVASSCPETCPRKLSQCSCLTIKDRNWTYLWTSWNSPLGSQGHVMFLSESS